MNMVGDIIYYWHNGGTAGSSSFVALAPDKRTALVVLSNSSLSVDDISNSILQKVILAD
jgi:CubicO group peptidase (beta-lactamase class C family)